MRQKNRTPEKSTARKACAVLVAGATMLSLLGWGSQAGAVEQSAAAPSVAAIGARTSLDTVAAENEFLVDINGARAMIGSPPLMPHPELQLYARAQAQAMANGQQLVHSDISVLLGVWSNVGENIGMGPSVVTIHNALMASPGHWTNLMNPAYTYGAIGVVVDGNGTLWTAHVFVG
jgi:uncharacterized protein YkwD